MTLPHHSSWEKVPDKHLLATRSQLSLIGFEPTGDPVCTVHHRPALPPVEMYRRDQAGRTAGSQGIRRLFPVAGRDWQDECMKLEVARGDGQEFKLPMKYRNLGTVRHQKKRYVVVWWDALDSATLRADGKSTFYLQPL